MRAESSADTAPCPWCGALVPDIDGPIHRYMISSPGCWATFGTVLEREYANPTYARLHRLTVDAYAVQHPGESVTEPLPAAIRSVCLHLISLHAVLERRVEPAAATALLSKASQHRSWFRWLEPPASVGEVTVADVALATSAEAHEEAVTRWATSAWNAWQDHHATVATWVSKLL
ncbi:MAG: DUF5946 family protein [Pseudomonadota bacterium]